MDEETRDKALEIICQMSDRELDQAAITRLKPLLGLPNDQMKDALHDILDDCVFYAWGSGRMIIMLDILWRACGGVEADHARLRSLRGPR